MATMEQRMLQEWIAECKSLSRAELSSYGRMLKEQKEITEAIYGVFQQPDNELRDSICGQLFEFYRSGDSECRRFCLQYIPSILYYYLTPSNKNKSLDRLEALLLGIYNLDVVEVDGRQKVKTCIIPTLAKPSIYHEPVHLSSVALTESALSSHQKKETQLIKSGPFPQEKIITAQNRFSILSHVLYIYNTGIACMKGTSHEILCKMCSHLCTTGYTKQSLTPQTNGSLSTSTLSDSTSLLTNGYPEYQPRVHLSPEFMIEMLTGVYYVMFNGHQKSGREALENIHYVACQQLLSEVILVTSAIKNSLSSNPSGQPADGPIGISIALTPSTPTFTRAAITNASFKARRVSRASGYTRTFDDITITVTGEDDTDTANGCKGNGDQGTDVRHVRIAVKKSSQPSKTVDTVKLQSPGEATNHGPEPNSSANKGKILIAPASHSRDINISNSPNKVESLSPGRMETKL